MASLDGWRALSILAVLAAHSHTFTIERYSFRWLQDFGGSGVYVFFSISGLLICTRLLEEAHLLGRINLRGFYIRRILRIQPAAIAYLIAVAAVSTVGWLSQSWRCWFGSLFLYRNYQIDVTSSWISTHGYLTGHFWTLAVEEHFYLLLSLVLYFVVRRRELWITLALLASLLWPILTAHYFPARDVSSGFRHTDVQLQYLMPATWLAVLLQRPRFYAWAKRWLHPLPIILGTAIVAAVCSYVHNHLGFAFMYQHRLITRFLVPLWPDVYVRMFPLWVIATVLQPSSIFTRFLELSWLRWVGKISYSLYLWHVLFFRGPWPVEVSQPRSFLLLLTHGPWNLIAALACASASFYLFERPLMRLGHRLAPPATPGRLDMQTEPSIELAIEQAR